MTFNHMIAVLSAATISLIPFASALAGDCKGVRNNPRTVTRALPDSMFKNNYEWRDLKPEEKDLLARVSISARNARINSSCVPFTNFSPKSIKNVLWADGESFEGNALPALNRMFIDLNTDPNIRAEGTYVIISSGYRSFKDQLSVWAPSLKAYFFKMRKSLAQYLEIAEEDLSEDLKTSDNNKKTKEKSKAAIKKSAEKSQSDKINSDTNIIEQAKAELSDKPQNNKSHIVHKNINDLAPDKVKNKSAVQKKSKNKPDKSEANINPRYNDKAVSELRAFAGARFAFPGFSSHQRGNAVDLQIINENGRRLSAETSQGNINQWCRTPTFKWLVKNAHKYGFVQGKIDEPWHWEYHPDKAKNPADIHYYAPSCRKYLRS